MGRYTKIPQDTFDALQTDAGVLLKNFDITSAAASKDTPGFQLSDIVCATTGGVNIVCQPQYSDYGEDVDNCPNNMKELKHIDGWNCSVSTTSLGTSAYGIKLSLGAADIDAESSKITPRRNLSQDDFEDLWWVGDKANGGFLAVKIFDALSTDGLSLQTGKNAKGQTTIGITGHVSIDNQDRVPMEFYSIDVDEPTPPTPTTHTVTQTLTHVTSSFSGETVEDEGSLSATLTAAEGYTISTVSVVMGETDITTTAYNTETHAISIASVTDDVTITATAVENV